MKYLKASQLALQKKIAGQALSSLRELEPDLPMPRLTKSGLPAVIGLRHRRAIYGRSYIIVRLWLTLFSLYRVISIPVKSKLNTITDPFIGDAAAITAIEGWMDQMVPKLLADKFNRRSITNARLLPLEKASPSNEVSWYGVLTDAVAIVNSSIYTAFTDYCIETSNYSLCDNLGMTARLFDKIGCRSGLPLKESLRADPKTGLAPIKLDSDNIGKDEIPLGQLAFKEEAAGKLRVFAMVDV